MALKREKPIDNKKNGKSRKRSKRNNNRGPTTNHLIKLRNQVRDFFNNLNKEKDVEKSQSTQSDSNSPSLKIQISQNTSRKNKRKMSRSRSRIFTHAHNSAFTKNSRRHSKIVIDMFEEEELKERLTELVKVVNCHDQEIESRRKEMDFLVDAVSSLRVNSNISISEKVIEKTRNDSKKPIYRSKTDKRNCLGLLSSKLNEQDKSRLTGIEDSFREHELFDRLSTLTIQDTTEKHQLEQKKREIELLTETLSMFSIKSDNKNKG
ncbi:hypothetical protein ACOME3_010408 [Neoechinorhynchus agilis]